MERPRIWGPDLSVLPSSDEHLLVLSATTDDSYALVWIAIVEAIGGYPSVTFAQTGERRMSAGFACDDQATERSERVSALIDDMHRRDKMDDVASALIKCGHYMDYRGARHATTSAGVA